MKTARKQRFAPRKFKELVLYIISKIPGCTKAQLCTALFMSDMENYAKTGRSITGATYIKGAEYPIPCKSVPSEPSKP